MDTETRKEMAKVFKQAHMAAIAINSLAYNLQGKFDNGLPVTMGVVTVFTSAISNMDEEQRKLILNGLAQALKNIDPKIRLEYLDVKTEGNVISFNRWGDMLNE